MSVSSLELLAQEYPDKTARELLAIQEEQKKADQKAYKKRNAKLLAFIEDIKQNGGYYRGVFGIQQHYFYKITDIQVWEAKRNPTVTVTLEQLTVFFGIGTHQVMAEGGFSCERKLEKIVQLDNLGLEMCERVTEKEWSEVNTYFDASIKFWDNFKPNA